jgi:hypothetical protein
MRVPHFIAVLAAATVAVLMFGQAAYADLLSRSTSPPNA